MLFIYAVFAIVYLLPGLVLARGMYAQQIRSVRNAPKAIVYSPVPPNPERPQETLDDMLHQAGVFKCDYLNSNGNKACNCKYRKDYIALKNAWIDYDEWQSRYGHLTDTEIAKRNSGVQEVKVNTKAIYLSVPFWPLVGAGMYIKGGANNIPDYREIERLEEAEMKEIA